MVQILESLDARS